MAEGREGERRWMALRIEGPIVLLLPAANPRLPELLGMLLQLMHVERWRSRPDGTRFLVHEQVSTETAGLSFLADDELPPNVRSRTEAMKRWHA